MSYAIVEARGATAVTLVPAIARVAERVTMLQRSPSYILSLPGRDRLAELLRKVLPERRAYAAVRRKNIGIATGLYTLCRRRPKLARTLLRNGVVKRLPAGYDVDTHFNPSYEPWDQRMCLVPNGDFFAAIRSGKAAVVTDHIERFTETGLRLRSGATLDADVIVTATGLNLLVLGGIELTVDGRAVVVAERSRASLPRQGDRAPWRLQQHYRKDSALFKEPVNDRELEFRRAATSIQPGELHADHARGAL